MRIENKTVVMSSVERRWVLHWGWFLAAPFPQANSSSGDSHASKKSLWLLWTWSGDLASGLTQVAHCNFTPTVWKNEQSHSDLFHFFCFCTPTSSLHTGYDLRYLLKTVRMLQTAHAQTGQGFYQQVLFVLPPSFPNFADNWCECYKGAFFCWYVADFLLSLVLISLFPKISL